MRHDVVALPSEERAPEMLATGRSVADVGELVGDATTSSFVAAFAARFGTTPGRYRPPDTLLAFLDSL